MRRILTSCLIVTLMLLGCGASEQQDPSNRHDSANNFVARERKKQ